MKIIDKLAFEAIIYSNLICRVYEISAGNTGNLPGVLRIR